MAALELCFSIIKEFFKKKVIGKMAFELISLFHVQIQEPTSRSTTTAAFVFVTIYLKQEVDDNLSICVDKHSPCGLSITGDIKIYQCHMIKR